jgi:hypothetical protein
MSDTDPSPSTTFCYRLSARKGAGVAPRVIETFAKRGLVPQRFDCRAAAETLAIDVEIADLDAGTAQHIARTLANIVEVERVAVAALLAPSADAAATPGLRASA